MANPKSIFDYPICQTNQNTHAEAFRNAFRSKQIWNATDLAEAMFKIKSGNYKTGASAQASNSPLLNLKYPLHSSAGRTLCSFLGLELDISGKAKSVMPADNKGGDTPHVLPAKEATGRLNSNPASALVTNSQPRPATFSEYKIFKAFPMLLPELQRLEWDNVDTLAKIILSKYPQRTAEQCNAAVRSYLAMTAEGTYPFGAGVGKLLPRLRGFNAQAVDPKWSAARPIEDVYARLGVSSEDIFKRLCDSFPVLQKALETNKLASLTEIINLARRTDNELGTVEVIQQLHQMVADPTNPTAYGKDGQELRAARAVVVGLSHSAKSLEFNVLFEPKPDSDRTTTIEIPETQTELSDEQIFDRLCRCFPDFEKQTTARGYKTLEEIAVAAQKALPALDEAKAGTQLRAMVRDIDHPTASDGNGYLLLVVRALQISFLRTGCFQNILFKNPTTPASAKPVAVAVVAHPAPMPIAPKNEAPKTPELARGPDAAAHLNGVNSAGIVGNKPPSASPLKPDLKAASKATVRPSTKPNFLKPFYKGFVDPRITEADENMTATLIAAGVTSFENLMARALSNNPSDRQLAVTKAVLERLQTRAKDSRFRDGQYKDQNLNSVLQIGRFQAMVSKPETRSQAPKALPRSGISDWEVYEIAGGPKPTYPRPPSGGGPAERYNPRRTQAPRL